MKHTFINFIAVLCGLFLSCNQTEIATNENPGTTAEDTVAYSPDDTTILNEPMPPVIIRRHDSMGSIKSTGGIRSPASVKEDKESIKKGTALVFCPAKMIRDVPSIINATISKKEFDAAYAEFAEKVLDQNPRLKQEQISKGIKSDSVILYKKMMVSIEFDKDEIKLVSGDNNEIKEFDGKSSLEWDWIVKPQQVTRRSIIRVRFYGIDEKNHENLVHEKTIDIKVTVDARSFVDKWSDFLLEDTKTTITAIVIPFLTFLGGFISGKKKMKNEKSKS